MAVGWVLHMQVWCCGAAHANVAAPVGPDRRQLANGGWGCERGPCLRTQCAATLDLPSVALLQELVCMGQRADLLAVGSMGHVQLLDPRRWASVHWAVN